MQVPMFVNNICKQLATSVYQEHDELVLDNEDLLKIEDCQTVDRCSFQELGLEVGLK